MIHLAVLYLLALQLGNLCAGLAVPGQIHRVGRAGDRVLGQRGRDVVAGASRKVGRLEAPPRVVAVPARLPNLPRPEAPILTQQTAERTRL